MSDFLIADPHFSPHPRDEYRLRFLSRLPELAREHGANCVYILGDLTQQKDKHDARLVNRVVDGLADLARVISTVILKGNHDYAESSEPFFRFLSNIEHITFVDKPTKMGKRWLLPHTRNHQQDWRGLNLDGTILTHNTFAGARGENKQELKGIPLEALPHLPIISGDVHVPQSFRNLVYIGAPYTINFGDDYTPRAVLLDQGKIKFIPLDGPQKRLIWMDVRGRWKLGNAEKGDIVRIRLQMRQEDYPRWAEFRERCEAWCEDMQFTLDGVEPLIEEVEGEEPTTQKIAKTVSDKQLVQNYCRRNKVDDETAKVGERLL